MRRAGKEKIEKEKRKGAPRSHELKCGKLLIHNKKLRHAGSERKGSLLLMSLAEDSTCISRSS